MMWIIYKRSNLIFHSICEIHGNPTLSKPEVRLSRARDNKYLLKLTCNCTLSLVSQAVVVGVKKRTQKIS